MMDSVTKSGLAKPGDPSMVDVDVALKSSQRVGVLVLGMHRSGSSAITRMLSLLGCDLPNTPMPVAFDNPLGHWESQRVADFNDEVLTLAGTQWDDWLPVNPRLSETQIWPQLIARGGRLVREEFAESPLFVMKDPRLCKLAGFWAEVLADCGIDPTFVLPLRNPIEVARSLAARNGFDEHQGLLIWLRHVLAAEAATRGRLRVFTDYATLLGNWEALAARISEGLGVVWPRVSALSAAEISEFLTSDMRHFISNTAELSNNPAISPWIIKAYDILLGWTRHGESEAGYSELDAISRAFDEAGIAFARPMLKGALTERNLAQAEAALAVLGQQHDLVASRLGGVEAELATTAGQRDAVGEERDRVVSRLVETEAELAATTAQRDATGEERDRVMSRLGEVEAKLVATQGQYEVLSEERDRVASRLDEITAELATTAGQRDASGEELGKVAWRLGEIEAELVTMINQRDAFGEERNKIAWRLGEVEAELATAAELRDAFSVERDKVAWRLGEVDAELARAVVQRDAFAEERAKVAWRLGEVEAELAQVVSQRDASADERDKLAWRLGEVEIELAQGKTRVVLAETRAAELAEDLAKANDELSALGHRFGVAESTLRQREEENFQLASELKATCAKAADFAASAGDSRKDAERLIFRVSQERSSAEQECQRLALIVSETEDEVQRLRDVLTSQVARIAEVEKLERELSESRNGQRMAEDQSLRDTRLKAESDSALRSSENRIGETVLANARLSRQLAEKEAALAADVAKRIWLQKVLAVQANLPGWWRLMPSKWRMRQEHTRLLRRGLFDAAAYLARYPDVASAEINPLLHYIQHGIDENRAI